MTTFEDTFKPMEAEWEKYAPWDHYVVVRCDGRSFGSWTDKHTRKPFDSAFIGAMAETCRIITKATDAIWGYVVSDEMTFVYSPGKSPFAGRHQKIVTTTASSVSVYFYREFCDRKGLSIVDVPTFDARMFTTPSIESALTAILWRVLDGRRNSVQMHARSIFDHEEVQGKSMMDLRVMCSHEDRAWESLDNDIRNGTLYERVETTSKFLPEEIDDLPLKHHARTNPNLEFTRSEVCKVSDSRVYELAALRVLKQPNGTAIRAQRIS